MPTNKLEQIFDAIAEALIQSNIVNQDIVRANQKTIKNGIIQRGREVSDKLILFEKDVKANSKDLLGLVTGDTLETISNSISDNWQIDIGGTDETDVTITLTDNLPPAGGTPVYDLTSILYDNDQNPINVSQFLNINKESQDIDTSLADEFLDTSIFELLGDTTTRQERIINFFNEFQNLIGDVPEFNVSYGLVSDDFSSDDYSEDNDISYANETPGVESSDKFITRLDVDNTDDENPDGKTLQSLRDTLNTYLVDIDQEFPSPEDQRPIYKNKSDGYLKFRNLNQGIIIRNTNQQFIEGLDSETQEYLTTGFTITMWVRFLDKVSEGTLFNFGNPTRTEDTFGFRLETYVLNKDDACPNEYHDTWNDAVDNIGVDYFTDSDSARFVRLLIDDGGTLRDSHVGMPNASKIANTALNDGVLTYPQYDLNRESTLIQNPHIPENFSEWYFICASFNPIVTEDVSAVPGSSYLNNADYWRNNVESDGTYTNFSNLGNRCKVEIISKTDLLSARGYRV